MLSPIQVGDAMLGHMCEAAVCVVDHVMPNVSKYWFHWEAPNANLGFIIPEWAGEMHPSNASKFSPSKPRAATA